MTHSHERPKDDSNDRNIVEVKSRVSPAARARRSGHSGGVLWFTGLPGSGKSTLAIELERRLFDTGYNVYVLDGDNIRHGLNADLGFTPEDRQENIRRVGEVAALLADAGVIVIAAFISPYQSDRDDARRAAREAFYEIAIAADLETCERRDPKGHYKRARAGQILDFTGVSAPYELPTAPDFSVDTMSSSVAECVNELYAFTTDKFTYRDPST